MSNGYHSLRPFEKNRDQGTAFDCTDLSVQIFMHDKLSLSLTIIVLWLYSVAILRTYYRQDAAEHTAAFRFTFRFWSLRGDTLHR